MEITRYVTKAMIRKFYENKDDIWLLSRAFIEPIIDDKRDIHIDIPIKIIILDKEDK